MGSRCTPGDTCRDANAECLRNTCQCRDGYSRDGDVCSEFHCRRFIRMHFKYTDVHGNNTCTHTLQRRLACRTRPASEEEDVFIPTQNARTTCAAANPRTTSRTECVVSAIISKKGENVFVPTRICGRQHERILSHLHVLHEQWAQITLKTHPIFASDERIGLDQPCDIQDVCNDTFAQCRAGLCKCRDDFYNKNGVCSEFACCLLTYSSVQRVSTQSTTCTALL